LPSFLVVQTSFLGDMILTTPLLARLAKEGGVDVVCTPAAGALLANHPAVREVIVYDKRGKDRGVGGMTRLASKLRARGYGAAFLAQGSVRSGALTLMAGIRERIGFSTSAGRAFYTTRVVSHEGEHHASRLLSLAGRGAPLSDAERAHPRPTLFPGEAERAAADALLHDVPAAEPIVALAPGSIWATKRWPYYADLARALAGEARIVVIGGEADRSLSDEIADARCSGAESFETTSAERPMSSADASSERRPVASIACPCVAATISAASG